MFAIQAQHGRCRERLKKTKHPAGGGHRSALKKNSVSNRSGSSNKSRNPRVAMKRALRNRSAGGKSPRGSKNLLASTSHRVNKNRKKAGKISNGQKNERLQPVSRSSLKSGEQSASIAMRELASLA
jgi:hypothetical protein